MKLFRNESGFALPLALLVMVTTSAILVTAIKTTSSTGRTANLGKTTVSAEALAEAGLANGLSILAKPGQNMNTQALFPSTEATATIYTMENGTAKLWGVYNTTTDVWTLYAKGSLPNPTGGAAITKTLSRTARCSESRPVQPCPSGAASSTTTRPAASRSTPSRFPGPSPRGVRCASSTAATSP